MNLHEHGEFRETLIATARHHELPEQFIEKDYYVTEILRIIVDTHPGQDDLQGRHQPLQRLAFDQPIFRGHRSFPRSRDGFYHPPDRLSFVTSDALFPSEELRAQIEPDYERECRRLFPAGQAYPPFSDVIDSLETLRDQL